MQHLLNFYWCHIFSGKAQTATDGAEEEGTKKKKLTPPVELFETIDSDVVEGDIDNADEAFIETLSEDSVSRTAEIRTKSKSKTTVPTADKYTANTGPIVSVELPNTSYPSTNLTPNQAALDSANIAHVNVGTATISGNATVTSIAAASCVETEATGTSAGQSIATGADDQHVDKGAVPKTKAANTMYEFPKPQNSWFNEVEQNHHEDESNRYRSQETLRSEAIITVQNDSMPHQRAEVFSTTDAREKFVTHRAPMHTSLKRGSGRSTYGNPPRLIVDSNVRAHFGESACHM